MELKIMRYKDHYNTFWTILLRKYKTGISSCLIDQRNRGLLMFLKAFFEVLKYDYQLKGLNALHDWFIGTRRL